MITSSPLRYPGGKSAMAGLLGDVRLLNGLGSHAVAEPFAGGAGAALTLLYREEAPEIYINDADAAIFSFWWSVLNRSREFLEMVRDVPVDMEEWRRQRAVYQEGRSAARVKRGFAAFYLNRCNRSGIIGSGGPIGGIAQNGTWKLDARFNRDELILRCAKLARYRQRIHVSALDGLEFIAQMEPSSTFLFIDPPYFSRGQSLYLNALDPAYHKALAERLSRMQSEAWVVTYDDCSEIRAMYDGWAAVRPFALRYVAADRRGGRELLITPKWMRLPDAQRSAMLTW